MQHKTLFGPEVCLWKSCAKSKNIILVCLEIKEAATQNSLGSTSRLWTSWAKSTDSMPRIQTNRIVTLKLISKSLITLQIKLTLWVFTRREMVFLFNFPLIALCICTHPENQRQQEAFWLKMYFKESKCL